MCQVELPFWVTVAFSVLTLDSSVHKERYHMGDHVELGHHRLIEHILLAGIEKDETQEPVVKHHWDGGWPGSLHRARQAYAFARVFQCLKVVDDPRVSVNAVCFSDSALKGDFIVGQGYFALPHTRKWRPGRFWGHATPPPVG